MIKKSVLKSFGQYNVPKMALALLVALIVGIVIYCVYRRFYTGVVFRAVLPLRWWACACSPAWSRWPSVRIL